MESAEAHGVSQPTVSQAICVLTPLLADVLNSYVPTADELVDGRQHIVDGT